MVHIARSPVQIILAANMLAPRAVRLGGRQLGVYVARRARGLCERDRGARIRSGTRVAQERDLSLDAQIRALLPDYPGEGKIQEAPQRGQVPGPREQDPKAGRRARGPSRSTRRARGAQFSIVFITQPGFARRVQKRQNLPDGGVVARAGAVPSDTSKDAGVVFSRRSSSALPSPTTGVTTPEVLLAPLASKTAQATSIFAVPR